MNQHNTLLYYLNSRICLALIISVILLISCEKEDPEPMSTNSMISGFARIFYADEGSNTEIKVVADGPYGQNSTLTDENGSYTFNNVGNGTYALQFSKEGYGTLIQYNIQVFESDTVRPRAVELFRLPEKKVLPAFIKAYVDYRDRFGPPTQFVSIQTSVKDYNVFGLEMLLFMDTDESVAWNSASFCYPANDANFDDENIHTIYVEPVILPFKTGEKVFVRGYSCNVEEYFNGYFDTYLGTHQFTTLDKSNSTKVVSFIMP